MEYDQDAKWARQGTVLQEVVEKFQSCRHPNCQSGQECYPEEDSYIICNECSGRTCITCDIAWHPEVNCAESQQRREEERGTEEEAASGYLAANSKLCPKYQVRGEKVSDCDHVTVRAQGPPVDNG